MIDYTNETYSNQLTAKADWLSELLSSWVNQSEQNLPDIYTSAEHSYRMRAEFRIWHEGDKADYAMYEAGSQKTYLIDDFSPAAVSIRALMPELIDMYL